MSCIALPCCVSAVSCRVQPGFASGRAALAAARCRTIKCSVEFKELGITRRVEQPVLPVPSPHPALRKLSILDLIFPPDMAAPLLLFFTAPVAMVGGAGGDVWTTDEIVRSLKRSLSQVLAIFYPMAGRLVPRPDSVAAAFDVSCLDQGALFSEAWADCPLSFFGPDFQSHPAFLHLSPIPFSNVPDALLYIQVTHFTCGGFCICLQERHILNDGVSTFHFFQSWIEILNGKECLTLYPFMDLSIIEDRYKGNDLKTPSSEYVERFLQTPPSDRLSKKNLSFTSKIFHFTPKLIATLRDQTNLLQSPTSYECITAYVWQNVTKAHQYSPNEKTSLFSTIEIRKRLRPSLPPGYFGNALIGASTYAKAGDLVAKEGFSYAMKLVRDATSTIRSDFLNSTLDSLRKKSQVLAIDNSNLKDFFSNTWTRLPFGDLDFPWGKPCCTRTHIPTSFEHCIILPSQLGKGHFDLLLNLESQTMVKFQDLLI